MKEGILYRNIKDLEVPIVSEYNKREIVQYIHRDLCHIGMKKLYNYLIDQFYIKNLFQITKEVVNEINVCKKGNLLRVKLKKFCV